MLFTLTTAALVVHLTLAIPWVPDEAKLTAKPGGKMNIRYGAPAWRDELGSMLSPGQTWRLGQGDVTTWSTTAGLVFADGVVFPGEYDLHVAMEGGGEWTLIFHHDGQSYRRESDEATTVLHEVEILDKQHTKRLVIELIPDPQAEADRYQFRATYGPRRMQGDFQAPKAKSAKAKAGKVPLVATWLLRSDLGDLAEQIEFAPTLIANFVVRGREKPLRVYLQGGEDPELFLADIGQKPVRGVAIVGQTGEIAKPKKTLEAELKSGKKVSFVVSLAKTSYHFEIPADALLPAEE